MSEFSFVHRAVSSDFEEVTPSLLLWKTCRRQILFLDFESASEYETREGDTLYQGHEAEAFLAEILCGLQSPLVGETEVFGQFKLWWKDLPETLFWKQQNRQRIDAVFSLVKSVREKVLCGSGSQSYGSILRRYLKTGQPVDLIGAGHLVQELIPWMQNKAKYRIWCRTPSKVQFENQASQIVEMPTLQPLHKMVVVAAPIEDQTLNQWLMDRGWSKDHALIDLRADSEKFTPSIQPSLHLRLRDFSTQKQAFEEEVQDLLQRSRQMIFHWQNEQKAKSQIRPYGWDDL